MQRRLSWAAPLLVLVIGFLALALGIAQRTIWQPPATISAEVTMDAASGGQNAPLAIIEPKALNQRPGPVTVTVQSEGPIFVAEGRSDDVDAWVGKTPHLKVETANADFSSLNASFIGGEGATANPAGSDLWTDERTGNGELSYEFSSPGSGDWSLLVANDGNEKAASKISLTAANDTSTPWSIPLIVVGSILILLAVLYLIFGRGSSNKPGGSGRRAAAAAAALVVVGLVAAGQMQAPPAVADETSSPSGSPSSTDSASTDSAPAAPVLTDGQFTRILDSVVKTINNADAAKDANLLAPRVGEAALAERTGNYKIRSVVPDYKANEPVADKLLTRVISTDRSWPRTVVAVTQGANNEVPQLLQMVQAAPRVNFKLTATTRLLPGQSLPDMGTAGAETVPLDKKNNGQKSATEGFAALADLLSNPGGANKDSFTASKYVDDVAKFQNEAVSSSPDATVVFKHEPQANSLVAFKTADGGTLVFGSYKFSQDATPKTEGAKLSIDDNAAAFTGGKDTLKGYTLNFDEQAVFYIPATGDNAQMTLLAAERGLSGATFKS